MKISGFTIIKNAVINDYPVAEAIESILPVVDEMIVLIGDCTDDTEALIRSINSPKIVIHHSVWNKTLRKGGEVLADETNKAFHLIDPASTWAFYIQADEVVHEQYHSAIIAACKAHENNKTVQGLLFDYLHFYGTYDYIGDSRRWYNHEVRIIRNTKSISAYRDAQGFRIGHTKLLVKPVAACIYHYGWVKSPQLMKRKMYEVSRYWHTDDELNNSGISSNDVFNFDDYDSLQKFTGTHPQVMTERIKKAAWKIDADVSKKQFSFKNRILYYIEKKTGRRLFDFRNYKLI